MVRPIRLGTAGGILLAQQRRGGLVRGVVQPLRPNDGRRRRLPLPRSAHGPRRLVDQRRHAGGEALCGHGNHHEGEMKAEKSGKRLEIEYDFVT